MINLNATFDLYIKIICNIDYVNKQKTFCLGVVPSFSTKPHWWPYKGGSISIYGLSDPKHVFPYFSQYLGRIHHIQKY